MYAVATITGHLGQDPKIFTTQAGMKIMSFGLPINNTNKETGWIQVKAFGKQVDMYEGKLFKGTPVSASGRLTPMFYTAKDGSQKSGWELNLQPYCLQFPSDRQSAPQQAQQAPPQSQNGGQYQAPSNQQYQPPAPPNLDDIPF